MLPVEISNLTVRYGHQVALAEVPLSVASGEVVALLGPNGAGKTTLLETIEGYRRPDAGTVRVFGADPRTERSRITHRWGVMPQTNGLPMGLTVGEAVRLFCDLSRSPQRPDDLMEHTGLVALSRRKWRRLSGGEQQRLSLALALAGGQDLLILDEPTAAVDQAGRERILALIRERAAGGAAVLMSTHRFDDVEACADTAVVLDRGRVVTAGGVTELTQVTDTIRIRSVPGLDTSRLSNGLGLGVVEGADGVYEVAIEPSPANVARVAGAFGDLGAPLDGIDAGRTSLEDVFRRLTGEADR